MSLGLQPGQTLSRVLPAATGGNGTLTYTLTPARQGVMSFDAATRTVTFTPAAAGTWSFNYKVTDADGDADTIRVSLRAAAASTPRFAAGASIRDLRLITGRDYGPVSSARPLSPLPLATGGDGARSYTLTPAVPGLSFDPRTRRITGTPTTAGSYAMTYRAVDSDADDSAADSATLNFTIRVVANSPPVALFAGQTVDLRVKIPMASRRHHRSTGIRTASTCAPTSTTPTVTSCNSSHYANVPAGHVRSADVPATPMSTASTRPRREVDELIRHRHRHERRAATQDFRLTGLPANRAPVVTPLGQVARSPNDSGTAYGSARTATTRLFLRSVAGYVTDPDGDPLTWTARSSSDPQFEGEDRVGMGDVSQP